jgi:hypothetical protein
VAQLDQQRRAIASSVTALAPRDSLLQPFAIGFFADGIFRQWILFKRWPRPN